LPEEIQAGISFKLALSPAKLAAFFVSFKSSQNISTRREYKQLQLPIWTLR